MNNFPFHRDSSCIDVQEHLEEYLAGELEPNIHTRVAIHVAFCERCQDEVRFARAISEAFHEFPRPEPSRRVFNTISNYVREHPNKGRRWLHRMFQLFTFSDNLRARFARVGALVCLVGLILFGTYQYQRHLSVQQAARDLTYALSKLDYAVERANSVLSQKFPGTPLDRVSRVPFIQVEGASRRIFQRNRDISSAIHRSLDR